VPFSCKRAHQRLADPARSAPTGHRTPGSAGTRRPPPAGISAPWR
jgi:hypothetical protein